MSNVLSSRNSFKVLSNEMRRQIMQYLKREGASTFTQIMSFLGLDPLWQCGTITYHLNFLIDSGIIRKYKDGYILTSKGKLLTHMIEQIERIETKNNSNESGTIKKILERLNPRFVCWLLAVAKEVKPVATIPSIDKDEWTDFLNILHKLNLCWSYKGVYWNGYELSGE